MLSCNLRLFGCPECDRLWREYSAAKAEHLRQQNKLKLAILEHNKSAIDQLTSTTDIAAIACDAILVNVREHEATHGNAEAAIIDG